MKSILGISEEMFIWTGVSDDIRELLLIFLMNNNEANQSMSYF